MNVLTYLKWLCTAALILLCAGCAGTGFNDYTLDYVPVDDIGDTGGYSYLDEPVALYAEEPESQPRTRATKTKQQRSRTRFFEENAQADPEPVIKAAETTPSRVNAPQTGRTMQTATIPGLEVSRAVPAFEQPKRRFTQTSQQKGQYHETEVLEPRVLPAATVTHVNIGDKYAILKCEKTPARGEDAQIYRNGQQVATVRFVSSRKGRYIVADIIEGEPQRGDIAKFKILFPREGK